MQHIIPALLTEPQLDELVMANAGAQAAAEAALELGSPLAKALLASTKRADALLAHIKALSLATT